MKKIKNIFYRSPTERSLSSDVLLEYKFVKITILALGASLLCSVISIAQRTIWLNLATSDEYRKYLAVEKSLLQAKKKGVTQVISSPDIWAAHLNFIAKQLYLPEVATMEGGMAYQFWDSPHVFAGKIQHAIYISFPMEKDEVSEKVPSSMGKSQTNIFASYFKYCSPLEKFSFTKEQIFTHQLYTGNIFISYCNNKFDSADVPRLI